jgi:glycosyltransferase involved in cell wall biosynthesis
MNVTSSAERPRRVMAVVRHPVGGVRTHILYSYPILMRVGYRFTFVVPRHEAYTTFCADVAAWDGAEVVRVPYASRTHKKPKFCSAVRRLLRERRFSLIHSHGVQAAVPTIFANVGVGLPHVATSHDVFCQVNFSSIARRFKLYCLQRILRRLDVLIAVSNDARDDHLRHLPGLQKGPCRVVVIPNGIDLGQYPLLDGNSGNASNTCDAAATTSPMNLGTSSPLRKDLGIDSNTFLLGFLGRFMEQKGFLHLIAALDRLLARDGLPRPVHLLAVGSGDCMTNYCSELDRHPRVKQCVTFREHVPNAATILPELDLLVVPSLWEACPILPMEAMCMGVPLLGTDCVGLREVLHGTPSVMVTANDSSHLSDGIYRAMVNPWIHEARAYAPTARARFDVEHTGEQLRLLFDEILRRPRDGQHPQ